MAVTVFSVEPRAFQLVWGGLPVREMVVEVAGRRFEIGGPPPGWFPLDDPRAAGPGALAVDGLEPATVYDVTMMAARRPRELVATVRTATHPPGRMLSRFATLSDCHVGEPYFGSFPRQRDPVGAGLVPYPLRALRAARREAEAWGAGHLVARGDLTQDGRFAEARTAAVELALSPLGASAVLGNHDVCGPADVASALRRVGVTVGSQDGPAAVDLPGVRLILGHSPVRGRHGGKLGAEQLSALVGLAAAAPGPAVVVLHHPPRAGRLPTYYPPALPAADSRRLVRDLVSANPAVLLLAGHTHRNRRYDVGRLPVAEVGSTKDYPGQWAGYTLYEGGIAQVTRRIAAADVIAWTEMTGRALGGQWGRWSPGRPTDRSWSLEWPDRAVSPPSEGR